jgi:starch phosphorylase
LNREVIKQGIIKYLKVKYGLKIDEAERFQVFNALSLTILEEIMDDWNETTSIYAEDKQAYYLSAEFLMGRALGNNLVNLGLYKDVKEVLNELNININEIEEIEEDAGLGNGGLGRLAACFIESAATLNMPLRGYGIRYSNGLFNQNIEAGFQTECEDNWLKYGDPWSVRKDNETQIIEFADMKVKAVPYDTPIIGYGTKNVNTLRLWKCEAIKEFDFNLFNDQKYDEAIKPKNKADDISRVLYPNDSNDDGKVLRLRQQYFFSSASLKDIICKYKTKYGKDFSKFAECNIIQLNDTHPTISIPELIRILVDEEGMEFKAALKIAKKSFAYTNHTILAEALEKWDTKLIEELFPRILEIVEKIDMELITELEAKKCSKEEIEEFKILVTYEYEQCEGVEQRVAEDVPIDIAEEACDKIQEDDKQVNQREKKKAIIRVTQMRMANLAIFIGVAVNGVAALHTEILKNTELNNWYKLYPNKFQNKTNGITPRRWIRLCNPELSKFITDLLGSEEWVKELSLLKGLEKFANDEYVLDKFMEIKHEKKFQLAQYIKEEEGIEVDPDSFFDIQIKRLHEYKRQFLNALYILDLYYRIKENPDLDMPKTTFIFGAKAFPGYRRAKAIIKFITEIGKLIDSDKDVSRKIKVVFVHNYRVSYAQKLIPGSDLSKQISTSGKEASGTGNMKFMLNGTPTFGTLDGANVEIVNESGEENNFIFGLKVEDIEEIQEQYDSKKYYEENPNIKRVVDSLIDGTFDDGGNGDFEDLYNSLLQEGDQYYLLADFELFKEAEEKVFEAYKNKNVWAKKCFANICNAGVFSSDRTIKQYADEIWDIEPTKIK